MGAYFTDPTTGAHHTSALNSVTLTSTTNGLTIDTQGFDKGWCTFVVNVGNAGGAGSTLDITVEESADPGMAGATTVAGAAFAQIEADVSATFAKTVAGTVLVHGRQRYVRLVFTETGAISVPIGAAAVLTGPRESNLVTAAYDFSVTG